MADTGKDRSGTIVALLALNVVLTLAALGVGITALTRGPQSAPDPDSGDPAAQPSGNQSNQVADKSAGKAKPNYQPGARSPLAQPGETITKPFGYQIVSDNPAAPPPPPPDGVVAWTDAHKYVGQTITVEGRIAGTNNITSVCFLNFDATDRSRFYLVMFPDMFDAWPAPPERHFDQKTIRVKGKVELHRGRPQIKILKKDQVLSLK